MKPIAVLVTLALFSFHFVGAQTSPVYWILTEDWINNQWINYSFEDNAYNPNNVLTAKYYHSSWNVTQQRYDILDSYTYSLNQCDSIVTFDYLRTNNPNRHMDYYRTGECEKTDSTYTQTFFDLGINFTELRQTVFTYDSLNRKTKTRTIKSTTNPNGPSISTTRWYFDTNGNYTGYSITNFPPYPPGDYNSIGTGLFYNGSPNYYASRYGESGQYSENNGGDWYYYSYFNKIDSSLYYYNIQSNRDSTFSYKRVTINDTTQAWELSNKRVYKYNINQRLDSIISYTYTANTQSWVNDTLRIYEYTLDKLYRIHIYTWENNTWADNRRITYGYLPTSIEETTSQNNIILFPNPAADIATLTFAQKPKKPVNISIYTTTGQLILSYQALDKQVELPIQGLSNGLYIVKTELEGTTKTVRLSIVR